MREIKFRAWNDKSSPEHGMYYYDPANSKNTFGGKALRSTDTHHLMQFTGLKDKNGREIYEGDVLEKDVWDKPFSDTRKSCKMTMKIVFSDGAYHGITIKNEKGYRYGVGIGGEIIGNMYENPELLDGK